MLHISDNPKNKEWGIPEAVWSDISYSYILDLFMKMSTLAFEAMEFGLHSLKSGGAKTTANAGVLDQLFKHHSQRSLENTKDVYCMSKIVYRTGCKLPTNQYSSLLRTALMCLWGHQSSTHYPITSNVKLHGLLLGLP